LVPSVSIAKINPRVGAASGVLAGGAIMPAIAQNEAVARLTKAVKEADPDDLVEIHSELFAGEPRAECAEKDVVPLVKQIAQHIVRGLEIEEIVDLWKVVFPKDRNVHYDEETESIRYNEGPEPLRLAE
jgi:hypothetical protein